MTPDGGGAPEVGTRVRTVLVVDDSQELRLVLSLVLAAAPDFTLVAEAVDGRDAIARAAETRPDVILLDLSMPDMDGLEALPHLRATVPDAHVVVLSGYQRQVMAKRALEAGAVGYIEKGTSPAQMMQALRTLVEDADR